MQRRERDGDAAVPWGQARAAGGLIAGDLRRLDLAQVDLLAAVRAAAGVLVVLVVGLLAGSPASAVSAAAGAFSVGIASFQGVYATRVRATLLTSAGMAVSTLVGATAVRSEWLAVPVTALWAFAAGLAVALGPAATVIGLQCGVALLIAGDYPMTTSEAVSRAALVGLGGLVQTTLVVLVWPLRMYGAERASVAAAYRALAAYADDSTHSAEPLLPDVATLQQASVTVGDTNPFARDLTRARFRALVDLAERVRSELTALSLARRRAVAEGRYGEAGRADLGLHAAADRLRRLADAIDPVAARRSSRRWRRAAPGGAQPADAPLDRVADADGLPTGAGVALSALAGHLRAAGRTVERLHGNEPAAGSPEPAFALADSRPSRSGARPALIDAEAVLTVRANLTLRSESFRHALRLAAVLAVASVLYRIVPLERGYWVALTALVVLRPDFTTTLTRGVSRTAGTAVGAAAATLLAAELRPGQAVLAGLVAGCALAAYTFFQASQPAFATFLTGYIVFLLALVGLPSAGAGWDRLVDTAVGGLLALVAYLAWPTWEGHRVADKLADVLEAQGRYGRQVLSAYAAPVGRGVAPLRTGLVAARLARTEAEASVDRLVTEPARERFPAAAASAAVAAVQRYAQAVLALHARLGDAQRHEPVVEAEALGEQLEAVLGELAATLREGTVTRVTLDRLRTAAAGLERAVVDRPERALLTVEVEEVVEAVEAVAHAVAQAS
ncbi:FUSC family protein [Motilibacter aurantiacus]|uniref:FUSC family protein n=1 Tax=Motilibacter aurantiacus TaxID=2714955 RepID=UPI00140CF960|nr:FUSC family protein [Motilibacter aurantiacus]NHC47464.1 hypothetical protein [Motilibacter aurantiacus]